MNRDPNCTRCPLHKAAHTVCIGGDGSGRPAILFVGQNPGGVEDRRGVPFVGPAGQLLRDILEPLAFPWRVTNAVRCWTPMDRKPRLTETEECRPYLAAEIAETRPEAIVALGDTALASLTGSSGIGKNRGKLIDLRVTLRKEIERLAPDYAIPKVLSAWHPAYALKDLSRDPELRVDIANAVQHIRKLRGEDMGDTVPWREGPLASFEMRSIFAFDIETNAQPYYLPEFAVHMIGVHAGGEYATVQKGLTFVEFLRGASGYHHTLVGHNAIGYDRPALGLECDVEDTMLLSAAIDEDADSHSLAACVTRNLQLPPWKDDVTWKWAEYDHKKHWDAAAQYNARDTAYTLRLWHRLYERADERTWRLYRHLLKPSAYTAERMYVRGVPLSIEKLKTVTESLDVEIEKAREIVLQAAEPFGFESFNPNSYPQVRKLLFDKMGYAPTKLTEQNEPSTDAESLQALRLKKDDPVLEALLTYREHTKLRGWITPKPGDIDANNRTHPSYSIAGSREGKAAPRSGRTSSYGYFAPQRVPRRKDVRAIVEAPPGKMLIIADLSQIEMRTMAFLSREPNMLAVYRDNMFGGDLHNYIASGIARLFRNSKEWTDEDRSLAKPVGFGSLYGAEAFTLRAYMLNVYGILVTMSQAETLRNDVFFAALPGLPTYYSRVIADCKRDGYVLSPLGRRRKLPNIHSYDAALREEAARQAINSPNQAMGSDILLLGMNRIEETLSDRASVIANMHDAVLLEVDEGNIDETLLGELRWCLEEWPVEAMRRYFDVEFDVPIKADIAVRKSWEK